MSTMLLDNHMFTRQAIAEIGDRIAWVMQQRGQALLVGESNYP